MSRQQPPNDRRPAQQNIGRRPEVVQLQNRTSEHGAMDGYADEKRNSGVGAVGMGMLMGDMSDDDDDDDDEKIAPPPQKPAPVKQASLRSNYSASARTPPPQYQARGAHPPPGLHPPAPVMSPPPPGPLPSSRPNLAPLAPHPQPAQPRAAFMPPLRPSTAEPHPLQAPSTPIVAKFAVASREPSAAPGNPKNRTTVFGDEFWTRFNKMAKEEKQTAATSKGGSSAFLREYSRGAGRLSKWVWCCTILLLVCIAGGVGAGWYFTHNKPSGPPQAFGGSENENSLSPKVPAATSPVTPSTSAGVPAVSAGAGTAAPVRRRRHRATR